MTSIKLRSTVQENKKGAFAECPVTFVMEKIGGYWKPIILFSLLGGNKRYSELKKSIPAITEKVLIQQLKQLESDKLIIRTSKPVVPPFVTYQLSEQGKLLRPVLREMAIWAVNNAGENGERFATLLDSFPG